MLETMPFACRRSCREQVWLRCPVSGQKITEQNILIDKNLFTKALGGLGSYLGQDKKDEQACDKQPKDFAFHFQLV